MNCAAASASREICRAARNMKSVPTPSSGHVAAASRCEFSLAPAAARLVAEAVDSLRRRDTTAAERALIGAATIAPEHPEILRLQGFCLNQQAHHAAAIELFERSLALRPDDPQTLNDHASALYAMGQYPRAFAAWRRACEIAPAFMSAWFNLGKNLKAQAWTEEAVAPLERALEIAPNLDQAKLLLGDALAMLGRIDAAAERYRALVRHNPDSGLGWWGLANLKTFRFSQDDLVRLRALTGRRSLGIDERIAAQFALARALDDGDYLQDAYAAYVEANRLARERFAWDARGFRNWLSSVRDAFAAPMPTSVDADLGNEVIFIVGMPRSGSTLTEQILAAHSEVEGASELPDLGIVIAEESRRLGRPFPQWVRSASAFDWHRLGERYLERTLRWRHRKPRFTDKLPNNWMFVGAIRAMLPGARIVECRRDPLETCFSCFRQLFWDGQQFSYEIADLAGYQNACADAMQDWRALHPRRIHVQDYETLLADAESGSRALLESSGLHFESACLTYHETVRSVRTASAAQVREPMRRDTGRATRYGELLDPLRAALRTSGILE